MEKRRVYIDTSVIGGCFDIEFEEWSNKLFDEFRRGEKTPVLSDLTLTELENAPQRVRDILKTMPNFERLAVTEEAEILAKKYISEKAISEKSLYDALHIAMATVEKVSILASWNFKHIVNLDRISKYNAVNLANNYPLLEIRSPRDILTSNDDE